MHVSLCQAYDDFYYQSCSVIRNINSTTTTKNATIRNSILISFKMKKLLEYEKKTTTTRKKKRIAINLIISKTPETQTQLYIDDEDDNTVNVCLLDCICVFFCVFLVYNKPSHSSHQTTTTSSSFLGLKTRNFNYFLVFFLFLQTLKCNLS